MNPFFGMAGPAEAAHLYALIIGYGALVLLGIAAGIGIFARSRVATGYAIALALIITLLFTPWDVFRTIESNDGDVHDLVRMWRIFGGWWVVDITATIVATVRSFGPRAKPGAPDI